MTISRLVTVLLAEIDAARMLLLFSGAARSTSSIIVQAQRVHISTKVRIAWRHGLDSALAMQPNAIVPYKILSQAIDPVKQRVAA